MARNIFNSRKFKYGSVATGLTVAVVAIIVILNIILSLIADQYSWKIDMTSYDLYTITDSTKEIVNALTEQEKIELTVMYSEEEYPEQFRETLKRIVNLSDQITCKYVDPDVNPQILTSFGAEYSIEEGAIVVQNGDRTRVVAFSDMYEQDTNSYSVIYKTEEALASAMLYVTKEEIPLVYFVTGHGEHGYDALKNLIANNGADVEEVKLSQLATFDDQARVMVICGPTIDYSEAEIYQLQQFLANDYNYERDLFYFADPESPACPNLDAFLAEWGIRVEKNLVLESDANSASTFASSTESVPLYTIPSYTEAEVSGTVLSADYLCVVPAASAVTLLFETQEITTTNALLTTSEESYAKAGGVINSYAKTEGDAAGPFNLAAIATRSRYQDNVAIESHIFAAGSVDMLQTTYMTYNGNSNFLYEIYKMMVGETELTEMLGARKTAADTSMTLSTASLRVGSVLFIGIIPGIFLILGIIVFIRRRYL